MKGGTGCSSTGVYPYVICEDRAKKLDEFEDNVTLVVEKAKRFQSSLFQRSKFEFSEVKKKKIAGARIQSMSCWEMELGRLHKHIRWRRRIQLDQSGDG